MKRRYVNIKGYVKLYKHPKFINEHRLIWEQNHNACLLEWADVHHKDHDKQNNVWYNLQAMMHSDHSILENVVDMTERFCVECGSNETHDRNWYKTKDGFRCFICWRRNKRREKKR